MNVAALLRFYAEETAGAHADNAPEFQDGLGQR
jgi:hypothetical protein